MLNAAWVLLSILVAMFARSRGQSALVFFVLAPVLSPIVPFVFALVTRPATAKKTPESRT